MNIIDAHVHFSNIEIFTDTARLYAGVDYTAEGLQLECAACGVTKVVGMGVTESTRYAFPDNTAETPMPCDMAGAPPFLYTCPGINPYDMDETAQQRLEDALRGDRIVGLKIYAGYYPFTPDDVIYEPVYTLAAKYGKPVVIHTGDTFSERGLLDYARPLWVDRLAVRRRDVKFVLAHMGDPWVMDACEVAYKNSNVYLDLSGLVVGNAEEAARVAGEPLLADHFRQGLLYLNNYAKILFGTDWPLTPMASYIAFCQKLVPEAHWPAVFHQNAEGVFGI